MIMKRRDLFKSIGLCGFIPLTLKEKLYTFNEICEIAIRDNGSVIVYSSDYIEIEKEMEKENNIHDVLHRFIYDSEKYFKEVKA